MFYERLNHLCKLHGTSITEVTTKHLGVGNSTATSWKKGAAPRSDVVLRAAQHFGVTTDYLLGLSDVPTDSSDEVNDLGELTTLLQRSPAPARAAAIAAAKAVLHALNEE